MWGSNQFQNFHILFYTYNPIYVFQFVPLLPISRSHASLNLAQFSEFPFHMAVTSCFSIYYCLPQPYYSFSMFSIAPCLPFHFSIFLLLFSSIHSGSEVWGMCCMVLCGILGCIILKFHISRCEFFELWKKLIWFKTRNSLCLLSSSFDRI